ncbi:hypothetical protein ACSSZE_16290 [Acidithiobacillus caldus]
MDIQTVDQQYQQLQQEAQGVMQSLQTLAGKLKMAADGGNQDAREWLLDLKELAINIQQEQQQVMAVMQALHQAMQNQSQPQWQPGYPQTPQQQGYGQPAMQQQGQGGGFLSSFLNSGFGRAIELGAGFGIGDDLINSIF